MNISLNQKQTQKLSAKQIQLFNIIALPTAELEHYIYNEMAINPALEFDNDAEYDNTNDDTTTNDNEPNENDASEGVLGVDYDYTDYMDRDSLDDYKYDASNNMGEEKQVFVQSETLDFTASLKEQFNLLPLTPKEVLLGHYLIESIETDGYLRKDLEEIADDISFTQNTFVSEKEISDVLYKIKRIEPIGVGSKNLQECLLIQLECKQTKTRDTYNAIAILKNYIEDLSQKKYDLIKKSLKLNDEDFEDAVTEIKKLNPNPAGSQKEYGQGAVTIIPDFSVIIENNKVELFLNQPKAESLKISNDYVEMLNEYSKAKSKDLRTASNFIKNKVETAQWFIEALQIRESMMVMVAKSIVNHQKNYFLSGNKNDLKPMILKTIAEEIKADISTVSRIANNKYIATPYGTILLKELFIQGMASKSGEMVSTTEIKNELVKVINAENKNNPMSDDQIATVLEMNNYCISRRTVAKYRDELNISNKNYRKAS